ncbi:hypothetical protein D3C73_1502360 [compost metagenome]
MALFFAKIKRSPDLPGCHGRGEMYREPRGRRVFGRGREVRDWALTGKEVVQASQDQADLVMAAPIM